MNEWEIKRNEGNCGKILLLKWIMSHLVFVANIANEKETNDIEMVFLDRQHKLLATSVNISRKKKGNNNSSNGTLNGRCTATVVLVVTMQSSSFGEQMQHFFVPVF